jgi:hypothetical protein
VEMTRELKEKLEAAVGEELSEEAIGRLGLLPWRSAVGAYVKTPFGPDGFTTWQSVIVGRPKSCEPASILDATGWGTTGADGQRTFRLSYFACLPGSLAPPINVVATSGGPAPSFLTTHYAFVDNATDVEITISAWDPTGAAAPNIGFDWRCRVAYWDPF